MADSPYAETMTFGKRLKTARAAKGLTQAALGKGLGTKGEDCTKSVVLGWEKDRHFPRADQLALICERLGCSADYLLRGVLNESSYSPEALAVAMEIDSFEPEDRERLLTVLASLLLLTKAGGVKRDEKFQEKKHGNG